VSKTNLDSGSSNGRRFKPEASKIKCDLALFCEFVLSPWVLDDVGPRHNYGWLGLTGLAGLRRQKTEDVRRLEATGINVKTVKTT
jgi:hypothetical protein